LSKPQPYRATEDCGIKNNPDMPPAQCLRERREDIPSNYLSYYFPGKGNSRAYGRSGFNIDTLNFKCECQSDGFFHATYRYNDNLVVNRSITVYFSVWSYNFIGSVWEGECWSQADMRRTYDHEATHVSNAITVAKREFNAYMQGKHKTEAECLKNSKESMSMVYKAWKSWKDEEDLHKNKNPKSPQYSSGVRIPITCPK
jgi:hypothetical protein